MATAYCKALSTDPIADSLCSIRTISFIRNSATLLTVDGCSRMAFWANNGKLIKDVMLPTDSMRVSSLSPDTRYLSFRVKNNYHTNRSIRIASFYIWDILENKIVSIIRDKTNFEYFFTYDISLSNNYLVISGRKRIDLWDIKKEELTRTVTWPFFSRKVLISSNDRFVVGSCSIFVPIYIYDLNEERRLELLNNTVKKNDWYLKESCIFYLIEISNKFNFLIAASHGNRLFIWDLNTGELMSYYRLRKKNISRIRCSPDGSILGVSSGNKLSMYKLNKDGRLRLLKTLDVPAEEITDFAFNENNSIVAIANYNKRYSIRIHLWDLKKKEFIAKLPDLTGVIYSIDISSNGNLVSGNGDRSVTLWNLDECVYTLKLRAHKSSVRCVKYSHNCSRIASGGWDGLVILWNASTSKTEKILKLYTSAVTALSFSYDDRYLITGSNNGKINVIELKNYNQLHKIQEQSSVTAINVNKENIIVSFLDGSIKSYCLHSGHCQRVIELSEPIFSIDATERYILTGGRNGIVRLYSNETGQLELNLRGPKWSVFATKIIELDTTLLFAAGKDKKIYCWDLDGNLKKIYKGHKMPIYSLAFDKKKKLLISSGKDKTIRLWSIM
ncbi:MAG: hypothetical protein DRP88_09060 [Candidatus Neomarinimicrobiota bacterium]|nr:MAG: hypothetical protein DRP88_09060 [Candidatus Neomarinimicrobiota bacterium]